MLYRPQFVYSPMSADCIDVRTHFSFDYSNTPVLNATIASSWNSNNRIPLTIDKDAPFFLRGVQVSPTSLQIGLLDPLNNPIVDNGALSGGAPGYLPVETWCGMAGAGIVPLEGDDWGIFCPAGSRFSLYLNNGTGVAQAAPIITLHGVKRYRRSDCR